MSHVFSFMPLYLQQMNVAHVGTWVGILSALIFVVGLPLVPLWGVWANRIGGKIVIIRSAYVEMVVFGALGLSQSLVGVLISMMLVGFQLGNTGIMLSSIRDRVPNDRVGFAVSLFSVSSPLGMALGPLVGGALTSLHSFTLHDLYLLDGGLSFATGTMLLVFFREQDLHHARRTPGESVWTTAWKSVRFTFSLRITWILFGVYLALMVARQMVNPYLPIAIEHLHMHMTQRTVVIGGLMGWTAFVGAIITVFAGKLGDRVGFVRILAISFAASVPVTLLLGTLHQVVLFTFCLAVFSGMISIGGAMVFSLFATRIPQSHRSTAMNLVYLPLYLGGIIGPATASGLIHLGLFGPFAGAGLMFFAGFVLIMLTLVRQPRPGVLATLAEHEYTTESSSR